MLPTLLLAIVLAAPTEAPNLSEVYQKHGIEGFLAATKEIERKQGVEAVVKAMTNLLAQKNVKVRAAAAHVLGRMGTAGRAALPQLAKALQEADVAEPLNKLGAGDIPLWLAESVVCPDDPLQNEAYSALSRLRSDDERVVAKLTEALRLSDLSVRWHAVGLLGEIGPKAATAHAALVRILTEEPKQNRSDGIFSDNEVRAWAALSLGCIGAEPEATVRLLTTMIKYYDPEIQTWSALGLGKMGEKAKAAIPSLVEALADEKFPLSRAMCAYSAHPEHPAATALVNIGPSAIPALIEALRSKHASVRRHAADALWFFGPEAKSAATALIAAVRDENKDVREQAVRALASVEQQAKIIGPALLLASRDSDRDVRIAAIYAMEDIEPKKDVPVDRLKELQNDSDKDVRKAAGEALERLEP